MIASYVNCTLCSIRIFATNIMVHDNLSRFMIYYCHWVLVHLLFQSCRDALMVVTDIKQCLNDLEGDNEDMAGVLVELVDPSMAAIYAKSKRGKVIVK